MTALVLWYQHVNHYMLATVLSAIGIAFTIAAILTDSE